MESVAAAQQRILAQLTPLGAERVEVSAALGRVLAEPVVSRRVLPPFDNSAMDGYAVRAAEIAGACEQAPVVLAVAGESRAGASPIASLPPHTAMRIMTGAPLPSGADAVVRYEDTDSGRDRVAISVAVPPGESVRHAGEDMRPGETILGRGRRLRAADLAACAALGLTHVEVGRRPRVGVLSTGDELVAAGVEPGPGQIVDSNALAIAAAVLEAGGEPVRLGIAPDSRAELRGRLLVAGERCDMVISSAGVSMGDHDHVRDVVTELGALDFWRVAMRPGKPLAVGRVGALPFLGLPGNPVSSQVTFELFARPAILALQGAAEPHRRRSHARTLERMSKPQGLETFARAILSAPAPGDLPGVRLTGAQGSGIMRSMVLADCLVVLPAVGEGVAAGAVVEIIPLV